MTDIVSKKRRSEMMSNIGAKETKPEILVRKYLYHHGFRYRKNINALPGKPDIVLRKYNTIIFVHGCYWHRHENCKLAYIPKTNTEKWLKKFEQNKIRDNKVLEELKNLNWYVFIVWECEVRNGTYISILDSIIKDIKMTRLS